jgi:hypothetical protein
MERRAGVEATTKRFAASEGDAEWQGNLSE